MELRKKKPPGPESNALFWCREGKDPPGFKIKNFTKKGTYKYHYIQFLLFPDDD